jgi:hypothetical protein
MLFKQPGGQQPFPAPNKKPAEAGFLHDHSNILSVAVLAMVDHP